MLLRAVLLFVCTAAAAIAHSTAGAATPQPNKNTEWLKRDGTQFLLGGKPTRYSGTNIYWLGLDENENGINFPTHFRIRDVIDTADLLGFKFIRSHTVGISAGSYSGLSFETALGVFNDSHLDAADYAVWYAGTKGIRIVAPLTDNWYFPNKDGSTGGHCYFHGCFEKFTSWLNVSYTEFYTNQQVVAAFKEYITRRLNHVNKYTGVRDGDNPTMAMWETGNELGGGITSPKPPAAWTDEICTLIKSLTKNNALCVSGTDYISLEELPLESVDVFDRHFYPPNVLTLQLESSLVARHGKVYLAGEIGWTYTGEHAIGKFYEAAIPLKNVGGLLTWSLFAHRDDRGFEMHGDGFTFHYPPPANDTLMQSAVLTMRYTAWEFRGETLCASAATCANVTRDEAPVLNISASPSSSGGQQFPLLSWRGVAGATYYTVIRHKPKPNYVYREIAQVNDYAPTWVDNSVESGQEYEYFLVPYGQSCGILSEGIGSNRVHFNS